MTDKTFLFQINVTRDCNLRCTHCYISTEKKVESKYMSDEQFLIAIEQIVDFMVTDYENRHEYGHAEIHVIGGEPTMLGYKFFERNIPIAREKLSAIPQRVSFSIVSNLITPDSVKIAHLFDIVSTSYEYKTRFVSLLGKPKPVLENKWLENVKLLRKEGIVANVTMAVTKQAVDLGASKILNDFYTKGFKKIHLGFFIPSGDGRVNMDSVFPLFKETTQFMIDAATWYLERRLDDEALYVNPIESMIESIYNDKPMDDIVCPIIPGSLDIDWNGETVTCIEAGGEVDMESLGNIYNIPIKEILLSPQYRREKSRAIIAKPACRGCDELLTCQSGCGVLHKFWDGTGECPGFKGFIKHIRNLVENEGIKPKSLLLELEATGRMGC